MILLFLTAESKKKYGESRPGIKNGYYFPILVSYAQSLLVNYSTTHTP